MKIVPIKIGTLKITDINTTPVSVDFVNKQMAWVVVVSGPRIMYKVNYFIGSDKFDLYLANFTATNFKNYILTDLGLVEL